ncbi:hypothetical protein SOPP22_04200 [Shewanella sp. OPT22]|nr:hypothetical protein SOPP22_04200 [Shewanella sp. OPT22]
MTMILLALLNGILIGLARTLNGRLGSSRGAFPASFVNHFVGFVFLTIMLWLVFETPNYDKSIPTHAYLGGIIGALYVAVNSFVLHKVGAVTSILCVLSGQMLASLMIDMWLLDSGLSSTQILGVLFIFAGMYLTLTKKQV